MDMVDALLLVTQITSVIAFCLIMIAIVITLISLSKFTGDDAFKRSLLFLIIYLTLFMIAVGFMSLYHWLDSEFMEGGWYLTLNIGLLFGIISGFFSFWKQVSFLKKTENRSSNRRNKRKVGARDGQ